MHGAVNEDNVTPISCTTVSENSAATPPTPALRNTALQTNSASESSSDEERQKESNVANTEPIYASIELNTESPKKSRDNQTNSQHPTLSRSPSKETVYSEPWDSKILEDTERLKVEVHPTPPPSYQTDGSENSLSTNSKLKPQRNRVLPKAQYAIQQKGVVIFGAAAIVLGTSTALAYLQDKAKFIAFFTNNPLYTIVPIIAVASLLAMSPIFLGIKQFRNTEEHHIQKEDANKILNNILSHQPEGKVIKSVRLEYSNGTHSNFVLNAWESKKGFVNIDEKVISKTNKIESVINNRPLFTALLTGVVAANIALPLLLYAEGGVNNIQKFYQNPLTNNIRLLPLTGLGIVALLAVCVGVHYYRKTNCTNLVYSEETIDPKNVNGKFIEEIKQERTNVLGENHSKDAKRSSLTLEQVVVQSHNCKDVIYSVGG